VFFSRTKKSGKTKNCSIVVVGGERFLSRETEQMGSEGISKYLGVVGLRCCNFYLL